MVAATGSNQTAKARSTATALSFNASTNVLSIENVYVNSNLGIGTTNPQSQFHITGQFQSTRTNSTADGGGQIYLNGATGNRIDFNTNGTGSPTTTTRSVGTKIVLSPAVSASNVDYAFGIDGSQGLWYSVPSYTGSFKWYAGTLNIATLDGTGSFTAQTIQTTRTFGSGTGSGQIYLNGTTGNRIDFNQNGVAAPAFTTRSAGTKIVLYPAVSGSAVDYAFGIDSNTLWSSVDNTSSQFKWYGGTTLAATLTGAGAFSAVGAVSGTTLTSTVSTGTAPLTVTSTTQVTNLNAQYHNGLLSATANTINTIVARDASGNFSAGTITATLSGQVTNTVTGTNSAEIVRGNMADNDQFRILIGGTASNAGFVEIATADDGTEPIYVRQYTGVFSSITRTATLLDGLGNTTFPNTVTASTFSGSLANTLTLNTSGTGLSGSTTYNNSGAATFTVTSNATSANTINTIVARDGSGNFTAGTISAALSGNASTATNILNAGTVTLATATESNSIYITQPSYTTDQPVKLLNFDWYGNTWSLGNIRSGATPSNGFGVYSSGTERVRFTTSGLLVSGVISASGNLSAWSTTTPGTGVGGLHLGAASATSNAGPAITFGARDSSSGGTGQAGIYINSDGSYGTRMYFATTDSYATGSKTAMSINELGYVDITRSGLTVSSNITNGGFDFILGNSDQSSRGNSGSSRAFVKGSSATLIVNYAGDFSGGVSVQSNLSSTGEISGTIFKDYNNTGYYVDPASTSNLALTQTFDLRALGQVRATGWYGQNSSSHTGPAIEIGVSNPDSTNGYILAYNRNTGSYLNMNFNATAFNFGGQSGGFLTCDTSVRSPIFYDSNNTSYYTDPASTSYLNLVRCNNWLYLDQNYGHSIVGAYASTRYQGVFAMGDSYKLPADGTSTGNLYGIAWSHPNAGGVAGNLSDHGALFLINGGFAAAVSSSIRCSGDMRTPIYYDQNDTGYYVDPNSTSDSAARMRGGTLYGPNVTWGAYLLVGGNSRSNYTDNGSVASVCTSDGNLHLDASSGHNTYLNYYDGSNVYFGGGSNNTVGYVNSSGQAYFPILYDYNDSGYYCDPSWFSQQRFIRLLGDWNSSGVHNEQFTIRGTYPSLCLRSTNGGLAYWLHHVANDNSLYFYGGRGATDGTNWEWAFKLFGNSDGLYTESRNSSRAPIFYDSNDTSYYVDPNSNSQQYRIRVGPYAGSVSNGIQVPFEIRNGGGTGDGDVAAMSFHCAGYYAIHMHLRADSYFGIGGWSASSWRWYVQTSTGDMTAAGNVTAYSDIRLKENIKPLENCLSKLMNLNGVSFNWKDLPDIVGHPGKKDYGIIAQEVEKVFPEVIHESAHESPDGDKYKTVAYDKLVPVLIEAIKEQQNDINNLKQQIKELKSL